MNTIRQKTARRAALAIVATVALAAQLAVQVVVATPASAARQLIRVVNPVGSLSSSTSRQKEALCETGVVVGGGATIVGGGDQVKFTDLRPARGTPTRFVARAEEPDTGYASNWGLEVYAICAVDLVRGWDLKGDLTADSSSTFKTKTVGCPDGKKVIGTGAKINHANGQVGLTLVRPAGPLDIARAAAREDADGYAQDWNLAALAICAERIESAAVYGEARDGSFGVFNCPPDKRIYSVGGGGGLTDSGPYFLRTLFPNRDLTGGSIFMTGPPIGGIAAGATCAFV